MRTRPLVIAHRGNSGEAPENTRVAFEQAIELGVDFIEFDVNSTCDAVPVVFHGPELRKIAQREGKIHDITFDEARQLDIGAWKGRQYVGERMMTLAEVLALAKGKAQLAVDVKAVALIPSIVHHIQEADMVDAVMICGCDVLAAQQVRSLDSRFVTGLNMDDEMYDLAKQADTAPFNRAYVQQATHHQLSPLNVNYRYITPALVRHAHLRALPMWAWTVDDAEDMRRLIQMGVDAIYTNYPKQLLEQVGQAAPDV